MFAVLSRTSCAFGAGDSTPIDQTPARNFNIDPASGRVMPEILSIIRTQDSQRQMQLLSALDDFKSSYLPSDVSDSDALRFMCPRLCQLPSQLADFQANLAMMRLEKDSLNKDAEKVAESAVESLDRADGKAIEPSKSE